MHLQACPEPGQKDGKGRCFVPIVHLMNHKIGGCVSCYFDQDGDSFNVYTYTGGKARAECFVPYGSRSNADLLTQYGFAIEDNSDDYVTLDFFVKVRNKVHRVVKVNMTRMETSSPRVKV